MKQIISVRDLEELVRAGKDLKSLPSDALLTPSARDFLREHEDAASSKPVSKPAGETTSLKAVTSKSSKSELETFFSSPRLHESKLQICDIGRRLWQRAYVDGNGGNI